MKELLLIPVFSLAIYLLYVYFRYGMTDSISATQRLLRGFEKPWFSVTLVAVAIPIIIVGINGISGERGQFLFFLAGAAICLVAASPAYWAGKHELTAHLVGSFGGIGFGMIACLVHYFSIETVALIAGFGLFALLAWIFKLKNHTYWVEVMALVTVVLVLYIH